MQKAAARRLLSIADGVGSAVLIVVPFTVGGGTNMAFPGLIGVILAAASFYWGAGERYLLCVGVTSFMLFSAFLSWGVALWGTYSFLNDAPALGLTVIFAVISLAFLLATFVASGISKDQK